MLVKKVYECRLHRKRHHVKCKYCGFERDVTDKTYYTNYRKGHPCRRCSALRAWDKHWALDTSNYD